MGHHSRIKAQTKQEHIRSLEYEIGRIQAVQAIHAKHTAIRMRLHTLPVPITAPPIHFVRPADYPIPTLRAWKNWILSRMGTFLLHDVVHVLCISCGIPIPVSSGDRTVIGARGKKTREDGKLSHVTVGAVVKWTEEDIEIWNVYNDQVPDTMTVTEHKVYCVVTHKALACRECQSHYLKLRSEQQIAYCNAVTHHLHRVTELEQAIAAYRKSTLNPHPDLLRMPVVESPRELSAYILVDPKVIRTEDTVEYWRDQER